jgi:hypothetical protein
MPRTTRQQLSLGLLALALVIIPFAGQIPAQTPGERTETDTGTTTTRTFRDTGFNPGWLGLLGLAGLAGLLPRKTHAVTTHRVGDGNVR